MRPLTCPRGIFASSIRGGFVVCALSRRARRGSRPVASPTRTRPALCDIDLCERGLQPLGKLLRIVIGPEVHEVEMRLVIEHVIVDCRNLDPVLPQRPQDRVHLLCDQHEIAGDRRLADRRSAEN